jgi:hexosaminidase
MIFKKNKRAYLNYLLVAAVLATSCDRSSEIPSGSLSVIPKPQTAEEGNGFFVMDETTMIIDDDVARPVGDYLMQLINGGSSFELKRSEETDGSSVIRLKIITGDSTSERYGLTVEPNQIIIEAPSQLGLINGVHTLRQLFPPAFEEKAIKEGVWRIPVAKITDEPRFSWRGMHLDVSRHFFSVEFVKSFIDRMAFYKFNKLHLHLTDDQGWRLQIKHYPQLTERGAWRVLNNQDSACIRMSETNPDFKLPEEFFKNTEKGKMYGGFYTQDEMKDVIAYASKRAITIVPEIDMPGHMNAAISEFPELTCVDEGGWGKLFTIPLCPCEESTYTFVNNLVEEISALFPGEYIHIGADEVDESTWGRSKSCQSFLKENRMKPGQLHSYFVNRVNKIVNQHEKKAVGWDEIIDGEPDTSMTVMYWRGWVPDAPRKAAQRGHEIVMSPTSHCYFDYAPDNNSVRGMYNFNPIPSDLSGNLKEAILGIQANIWTEYIPTVARLDYMTMPRMIALSEVAWSSERDWENFLQRMAAHYEKLDALKISYRLPDIEDLPAQRVFLDTVMFRLKVLPTVEKVRYTLDGSEPNVKSPLYERPFVIDRSVTIKTLTFGKNDRRGNRKDVRFEKQSYLPSLNDEAATNGVNCDYYEAAITSVSQIGGLKPKSSSVLSSVEFPSECRKEVFALRYHGLIQVPADGVYTFYLSSDDGSFLTIGDREVVNNDGAHGEKEVSGQIALSKGSHPFVLKYFDGGGGNTLAFRYEGPGIEKQNVPSAILKRFK